MRRNLQQHPVAALATMFLLGLAVACADGTQGTTEPINTGNCPAASGSAPANPMTVLGCGNFKPGRTTAEIFVRGSTAYTTTWGNASSVASVFYIWDVAGDTPTLVDSVRVENATTLGDIAVSDDGAYLVVATERAPGSIVIYSLTNPRQPQLVSRFSTAETNPGVHTAEIGRVNGKLYGFLCIDPVGATQAKLVIVDLSNPASPQR